MQNIRGILFDKDGTLLDFNAMWIPAAHELVSELLEELGLGFRQDIRADLFHSIGIFNNQIDSNGVYAHGTASDIAEAFIKVFEAFGVNYDSADNLRKLIIGKYNKIAKAENREVVPTADLGAVLENLKKRGIFIGLSTSDTPESTESSLKKLGVSQYFDFIGTDSLGKKPAPDLLNEFCKVCGLAPREVAVVGDTKVDMLFARNGAAGCAIGVLTGVGTKEELEGVADVLYPSVQDLIIAFGQPDLKNKAWERK